MYPEFRFIHEFFSSEISLFLLLIGKGKEEKYAESKVCH
jgi:hypothetical protein